MEIKQVSAILAEVNIAEPVLNALIPNGTNYKVLLFQPQGVLEINHSVKNKDRDLAQQQFAKFLTDAKKTNADVVVTPEYSLPWETLKESIRSENIPSVGTIWVLGCESIKYSELDDFKQSLLPSTIMLYEIRPPDQDRFVCPLVYVFVAPTLADNNILKTVVLVQFKTEPSYDPDNLEANEMQRGNAVYQFGGTNNRLKLVSLICSDATGFTDAIADVIYNEALIIHIQLNMNPRHDHFLDCRWKLLRNEGDETEIICLNWAEGVEISSNDQTKKWKNISASAWYTKSKDFDIRDINICDNHKKGFYYTWHNKNYAHTMFINFKPGIFLVEATKVAHLGVRGTGPKRIGPRIIKTSYWDDANKNWKEQPLADDGFLEMVAQNGNAIPELISVASRSPIELERIMALSAGEIEEENWYEVQVLDS